MSRPATVTEVVKSSAALWTSATTLVSGGVALLSFVQSVGGPVAFLVEAGVFGFACYAAMWVVLPLVVYALAAFERLSNRVTTDRAVGLVAGLAVLGAGALLRGAIDPGFVEELDAIGTAFLALLGVLALAVPLFVAWYFKGSQPKARAPVRPAG